MTASHNPGHGTRGDMKGCESRLGASISAEVSYPGRSTETTDYAILAFVDPVWIITTPRAMEILESQVHVSLC